MLFDHSMRYLNGIIMNIYLQFSYTNLYSLMVQYYYSKNYFTNKTENYFIKMSIEEN